MNRESEKAMFARKKRTYYDPRGDIFAKHTKDDTKDFLDDREQALETHSHLVDREHGALSLRERNSLTKFWSNNQDYSSKSPIKQIKKTEIKTERILTGQEKPHHFAKQIQIASALTPQK